MACEGLVDWRGQPINRQVHGGVRAAWYLYFIILVNFLVHVPNLQNMTTYLRRVMHMGVSDASTTVTNFIGAMCGFALLGGFLSDSYMTCARTMLLSVPLVVLGYALLALQSHVPWLQPAPCNSEAPSSSLVDNAGSSSCRPVDGWRSAMLYIALYTIALGEGIMRTCIPALGSDQFDGDNPSEARQQSSFFNWFTVCLSVGSVAGLILIVWLENTKGWDAGFGLSALLILVGLLVSAAGLPLYRNRLPQGSALTRVLQVFVVAFKNRKLEHPEEIEETQQNNHGVDSQEVPCHTPATNNSLKFLDKACVETGRDGPWSLCSAATVEETKIVLRLLPLVFSSTVAHIPSPLLVAFTVQQGMATNTELAGSVHVYPAMLFIVPSVVQAVLLVAYDRLLVPLLRRRTGLTGGVTQLQRVAVGFLATSVAPAVAAVVERKRKDAAAGGAGGGQISLFWLVPQFFLIGVADTTAFVGLLEFFTGEAPAAMKSIGVAFFWCQTGMASLLGTMLVRLVNRVTRTSSGSAHGWLEGKDLNSSRLDLFYWVVAAVSFLGWLNYLYWAKRYRYRQDPRISAKATAAADGDDSSMP